MSRDRERGGGGVERKGERREREGERAFVIALIVTPFAVMSHALVMSFPVKTFLALCLS